MALEEKFDIEIPVKNNQRRDALAAVRWQVDRKLNKTDDYLLFYTYIIVCVKRECQNVNDKNKPYLV